MFFLHIQTHPHLSPITTNFLSFFAVWTQKSSVVKTISLEILSMLSLELEYWQPTRPNIAIFNVSSRYWNSYFSANSTFVSSILVSAKNLKPVKIHWWNRSLIFPSHQSLDSPEFPKIANTFDSSRRSLSSLSAITGLISSTKVAIDKFSVLKVISGKNYPFRSLQLTFDSPKISRIFFQYGFLDFLTWVFP